MIQKAAFSLEHYFFDKVNINLDNYNNKEYQIKFDPKGVFNKEEMVYTLNFCFSAKCDEIEDNFVTINCIGRFKFTDINTIENIPPYFYRNSIAILFPFLRGFLSMVTIQANVPPILLPAMNLTALEKPLSENTKEE
ncbi:Preprotein translocase subunit SecB [Chryseobacterium piscicola]|uniref:Preprotein translocase subunit SecB n=1 Tax=Chryseobacterium piscicola TaxID=551459 RepID=A0A1N7PHG7_9FLAO|nr:protein-export chaperone SecB [Chryseobacterium piscicola]PQA89834.1 hypothetical protein B0A70_15490 [Chryseobacterium piscicola]SIT10075.1 Preprotein translocase subunit SecB [Chryseobacterium piscicola]